MIHLFRLHQSGLDVSDACPAQCTVLKYWNDGDGDDDDDDGDDDDDDDWDKYDNDCNNGDDYDNEEENVEEMMMITRMTSKL